MRTLWDTISHRVRALKHEVSALYWAYVDPRTPWYARAWVVLVLAYALSPIDLIPDFIPVLGYVDDLILVPLGIWLALRMIPAPVMEQARVHAQQAQNGPAVRRWLGVLLVIMGWAAIAAIVVVIVRRI